MGRLKGIRDIRTHSVARRGTLSRDERHVHQFRVGCLELERSRLENERTSFQQRIGGIEARLAQIDAEIGVEQELLGYARGVQAVSAVAEAGPSGRGGRKAGQRTARTLRY